MLRSYPSLNALKVLIKFCSTFIRHQISMLPVARVRFVLCLCPYKKNLPFMFDWKLKYLFCFKILWEILLYNEYSVKKCHLYIGFLDKRFFWNKLWLHCSSVVHFVTVALCNSTLRRLESHRELFFLPVYLTCSAVSAYYGHYELLLLITLLGRWHLDLLS